MKNCISGTIKVRKGKSDRYKMIYSNCKWFEDAEYFDIQENNEVLVIKKCYMIIPKTAQKSKKVGFFYCVSELPLGTFNIDENESNEDELVIYYKENN